MLFDREDKVAAQRNKAIKSSTNHVLSQIHIDVVTHPPIKTMRCCNSKSHFLEFITHDKLGYSGCKRNSRGE